MPCQAPFVKQVTSAGLRPPRDRADISWMFRPQFPDIATAIRTPDGRQRGRLRQAVLVLVLYAVCAALQQTEVMMGLIGQQESNRLSAFYLTGALAFIALIRSGLNVRLVNDPSLTIVQCAFGMVALAGSYAITGPARGAVLCLIMMILVFSVFTMSSAAVMRLAMFGLSLLAGVMLWMAKTDPQRYPPAIELIHFLLAALVVATIALLSARMTTLRVRLHQQKVDLEQALEQVRLLATRDELTGLVNRRYMTELLAAEKLRMERSAHGMCLVLMDIDCFKRINDAHGHKAGDEVLKLFGQAVAGALRATDVVARWGGEEFLIMLPATTAGVAGECLQRVRASVANVAFEAIQPDLLVTFSAGVDQCGPGDDVQASIERADHAMYRAKQAGRNCTVSAQ